MHYIEFSDGQVKEYTANVISENVIIRVDLGVFSIIIIDLILFWKKDENNIDDTVKYFVTSNSQII